MRDETLFAEAGQQYETAHEAHYRTKDLREALELYTGVMVAHPGTREAAYSGTQIRNIVASVVPKQELLDVQVKMALAHLKHEERPNAEPAPSTPAA